MTGQRQSWLAVVLVLTLVVASVGPAIAADMTTIDADHGLATETAIDTYRQEGIVNTSLTAPAMRLTIAEEHEMVGIDGAYVDADTHYLQIQYNESIERTIRIYIPSEYWHPYPAEVDAVSKDVTATLRPTENDGYTAVTVTLSKPTTVVFPISAVGAKLFRARDYVRNRTENTTGFELPSLWSKGHWEYVDVQAQFANGSTIAFDERNRSVSVQYDAGSRNESRWVTVPECSNSRAEDAPYCQYHKRGQPKTVYVVAREQTESLPELRYQYETGMMAKARVGWDDLAAGVDDLFAGDGDLIPSISEALPFVIHPW